MAGNEQVLRKLQISYLTPSACAERLQQCEIRVFGYKPPATIDEDELGTARMPARKTIVAVTPKVTSVAGVGVRAVDTVSHRSEGDGRPIEMESRRQIARSLADEQGIASPIENVTDLHR